MVAIASLAALLMAAQPGEPPPDDPATLLARAENLKAQGRDEDAAAAYRAVAEDYDRRQLDPNRFPLAADVAAHARFELAEQQMAAFEQLKIAGSDKALAESVRLAKDAVRGLNASYAEVLKYGRLGWTCAALFRRAAALELLAGKLAATPTPPEITRMGDDAAAAYRDLLDDEAKDIRERAVWNYHALVDAAARAGPANQWTRRAREALGRLTGAHRTPARRSPIGDYPAYMLEK